MQRHVAGHADAIAQIAQPRRRTGRWGLGLVIAGHQGRQGAAQGWIKPLGAQGIALQNRLTVLEHPGQGDQGRIAWLHLAGFRIAARRGADRPGALVNPGGHRGLSLAATGITAPHLGRKVVGVGVEIALGAEVGAALLQGCKPSPNPWMLLAQPKPLVVSQACRHPFHIRHKHQIGGAEPRAQQERPRGGPEGLFHGRGKPLKLATAGVFLRRRTAGGAQPLAPGAKQQPLQLP